MMIKLIKSILTSAIILSLLPSCRYYKGHIMFQTEETIIADSLAVLEVQENYRLKAGDVFQIQVSGNNGEMIIDPDNLMRMELGMMNNTRMGQQPIQYTIQSNNLVKLPVIGEQNITNMSINEANIYLGEVYSDYYSSAFVNITLQNRRVVVFGASGGQVIDLENESMNLLEVLAISKEVNNRTYADNIRLIRGDLNNPNVQVIDLTTVEGMKAANLAMRPNDIVYVEPKKTLFSQAFSQNVLPIISAFNAVLLTYGLFFNNSNP